MASLGRDLLAQAALLAKLDPNRPKQASLRRSISTAYYGLFHFLIEESISLIVGTGGVEEKNRQLVSRAFEHTKMKELCQEFTGKNKPSKLLAKIFLPANASSKVAIAIVAQNFIDLQYDRHQADYDLSTKFFKFDAVNACDRAHRAITAWDQLLVADRNFCRFFALSLGFWPSLAKRK